MKNKGLWLAAILILVLLITSFGCSPTPTPTPTPSPKPTTAAPSPTATPTTPAPSPKPTTAAPSPTAAPAAIKLKIQTGYAQTHPISKSAAAWIDQLQKKTSGKVSVEIFYGTPLGASSTQLEMVMGGTVDLAYFSFPWKTGVYPLNEMFYLPLPITKGETVARIHWDLFQKGYLNKELSAVKLAWFADGPPGLLSTKAPIRKLDDFKGKKIRGTGIQADMIKRLGGTPIDLPSSEAYQALEKGVVDGIYLNMSSQYSMKLFEIVKYVTAFNSSAPFSSMFVMNPEVFKKLPADIQAAIDGLRESTSILEAQYYDQDTSTGIEAFKKAGAEFITLSAAENKLWADALAPIADKWVTDAEAKGFPAKKVLEEITTLAKKYEPK